MIAKRPHPLLAVKTLAAGDSEGAHHPIAFFKAPFSSPVSTTSPMNSCPRMFTFSHRGDVTVIDVEIGTADRGGSDTNYGISRLEYLGIRNCLDPTS
jgi:hypothetical protein